MSRELDELSKETASKRKDWEDAKKNKLDTNEKSIIGAEEYEFYKNQENKNYDEYKIAQNNERKQLEFEELRSRYRNQSFGSRFLAALARKKPKWEKIKTYSKEEIDVLIKIANGNDLSMRQEIKRIEEIYEKKRKNNPQDTAKIQKEMEKRIRDYRFNKLNDFLSKSRQDLRKHGEVEVERSWTR